ncbi:MAG TPA: transglycosylase SLT domain-containing protein, partial [Anaerolineales bacterium]
MALPIAAAAARLVASAAKTKLAQSAKESVSGIFNNEVGGASPLVLKVLVGVEALGVILMLAVAGGQAGELTGVNNPREPGSGAGVDCSGTEVPAEYLPWVDDAANKELGGDEAILIALIEVESGWNYKAKNSSSSATGLGQFITSTARSMRSSGRGFVSSNPIYDNPSPFEQFSDDARYDPKQSIYAAANLFGANVRNYLAQGMSREDAYFNAYYRNYHGFSNAEQEAASRAAAERMMTIYRGLIESGACQEQPQQ